jgi:hypothetical protein
MNSEMTKKEIQTQAWLSKLELLVTFKEHEDGAFISSNKYSEQLKTIIFSVVPKDEREWKKATFQWHIFNKAGVRQIQNSLNANNIKFLIITSE